MKTYYIYHITGIKIGCSTRPKYRVKQQLYSNFEILEQYTDIYIASDRELELQKKYGYKVDNLPYWKSYKQSINRRNKLTKEIKTAASKKGGSIGGKTAFKNKSGLFAMSAEKTKQVKIAGGKASSIVNKINGVGIYGISKEQRIKNGIEGNKKRAKGVLVFNKVTNEFISEYQSIREAGRKLNIPFQNISAVLKGKIKQCKAYTFKQK
jgi:hypothetical protein